MKSFQSILFLLLIVSIPTQATIPQRKGWWKFDSPSNLTKAETGYGESLVLTGTQTAASGPTSDNGAVMIGIGSYYSMKHQILPNGGGTRVNEYTLQYDFKIPRNDIWHCFFQITLSNSDDGDLFINTSGNIGVAAVGYSSAVIAANEWYRLLVSVKNGNQFTLYLDGKLIMGGKIQPIDGRFSLVDRLLIFADNDAEDGPVYCAELAVWDQAFDAQQAADLGGYHHATDTEPFLMTRIPYLQSPSVSSINICWHDTAQTGTKVEFGSDTLLGSEIAGTSEMISLPWRWHTVKLTGLQADTRYFYRVGSGAGVSGIYSFKTLPDTANTGIIRFIILSDTHCPDTTMAKKVVDAARSKVAELYGPDIENHINGILHSGDIVVSGGVPEQYSTQYFKPLSPLTPNIPTMVVAGNHENESSMFYSYLKMDELSAFPQTAGLNEKVWKLRVGNSLFIGMNTNINDQYGTTEATWLDNTLKETEKNSAIDFVFLFFHHPPFTELWADINNSDAGTLYVKNVLFPIIKRYSKVQQMNYGHTHGFERGTIQSETTGGDFRIVCGGGSGGALDPWAYGENHDFNDIHICLSHYVYQILEIDLANRSWQNTVYSLGSPTDPRNNLPVDNWYKKINQPGPEKPVVLNSGISGDFVLINTSGFVGSDSLMSVQLQLSKNSPATAVIKDSVTNWENIYGVNRNSKPVNLNQDINLNQIKIRSSLITGADRFYFRVRYRDNNLKWSDWSDSYLLNPTSSTEMSLPNEFFLSQNYPNPFYQTTTFTYQIVEDSKISFRIYDIHYNLVEEISGGYKPKGVYQFEYHADKLSSGIYYCEINSGNKLLIRKIIKTR